jgi:alanyl-tRNA synthetase
MGFERACSIMQGTQNFTNFSQSPTNYSTDVFQPIIQKLEQLSGKKYVDVYPESVDVDKSAISGAMKEAIAFRVIADHIRTLSFSLADGIMLGNTGRNYVLRRILRRAVRYGRTLGFTGETTFLPELVDTLVEQMSAIFPELKERQKAIKENLHREEASFNETLDRGLAMFEQEICENKDGQVCGQFAFKLYDTFGFPIDLTQLLCEERGMTVDMKTFEELMEQQRELGRKSRTQALVRAADISSNAVTEFVGFETDTVEATVLEVHSQLEELLVITDKTPFYVEMGGQLGDQGTLTDDSNVYPVSAVQQLGLARAHSLPLDSVVVVGDKVTLSLDEKRRRPIEAHHTATHLLHWALHELVSEDIAQQGSLVSRTRLRFDFNSGALTRKQLDAIETKVNACIEAEDPVSWTEVEHAEIKGRKDIQQFFGDKYGDVVRVVQVGGEEGKLNGYSMELCGGTHVRNTKDIQVFKIKSEGAIASGIRRIEAVCGVAAFDWARKEVEKNSAEADELRAKEKELNDQLEALGLEPSRYPEFPHIMFGMLAQGSFAQQNEVFMRAYKHVQGVRDSVLNASKRLKKAQAGAAAKMADAALTELLEAGGSIVESFEGDTNLLQELMNGLKKKQFAGAAFLIVDDGEKLHLGAFCGDDAKASGLMAGKLIQELAPLAGGKGGGRPDQARGAAPEREKLDELKAAAKAKL